MILQFTDKKIEIREEYLKSTISKSTGKELNTFKFKIKVAGKDKFENFKQEMDKYKENPLNELDADNKILNKYNIKNWNYRFFSEFDNETTSYLCDVEIMQIEELFTSTILIEGIENEVLNYKEEYDTYNDAIIIHVTIKTTEKQRKEINKKIENKEYFQVVRPEISQNVLEMRFGKIVWSKHDNYIKRNLILVEKKYDDKEKLQKPFFWPEMQNMMLMLAKNMSYIQALEEKIIEKELLSESDIKYIKEQSKANYKTNYRDFYLVDDAENI